MRVLSDTGRLIGADLRSLDFSGANLRGLDMTNVKLDNSNLQGVNLISANLRGASLKQTNLKGAKLLASNLVSANLRGAKMQGANLYRADTSSAYFYDANLSVRILSIEEPHPNMPETEHEKLKPHTHSTTITMGVILASIDLTTTALLGADLSGACGDSKTIVPKGYSLPRMCSDQTAIWEALIQN